MRALLPLVAAAALIAMAVAVPADATSQPPEPPVNQTPPTISGTPKLGQTLTAVPGTWSGTQPITFTYQWLRCFGGCAQIPGATGQTYTVNRADARTAYTGQQTVISVWVAAANAYGGTALYTNQASRWTRRETVRRASRARSTAPNGWSGLPARFPSC